MSEAEFSGVCGSNVIERGPEASLIALRDQFAMAALPKVIDSFEKFTDEQAADVVKKSGVAAGSPTEVLIALCAYRLADAMLEARKPK